MGGDPLERHLSSIWKNMPEDLGGPGRRETLGLSEESCPQKSLEPGSS